MVSDEELIDRHWGFIQNLLAKLNVSMRDEELLEYMYREAFTHGLKHAREEGD